MAKQYSGKGPFAKCHAIARYDKLPNFNVIQHYVHRLLLFQYLQQNHKPVKNINACKCSNRNFTIIYFITQMHSD